MSNPTAKSLYNALINKGYTSANIGDEETFISAMADKANRRELFDMVVNDGYDLGDYDAFEGRFTPQPTNVEQPIEQPAMVAEPMKSDTIQPVQPIQSPKAKIVDNPDYYPTLEQNTRNDVAQMTEEVDEALNEAKGKSARQYAEQTTEAAKGGFWKAIQNAMVNTAGAVSPTDMQVQAQQQVWRGGQDRELAKDIDNLEAAEHALENARRTINEADINAKNGTLVEKAKSTFVGGAARGFGQKLFDVRTWDMGVSDFKDQSAINAALDAAENGTLTESQEALLNAKAQEMAVQAYFGSYVGRGYKAGSVTAESLPFMLEMCINPASTIGKSASSRLARWALKKFGTKTAETVGRVAGRVLGDVAAASAMTATTGSIRTAADAMERMSGGVAFDTDEQGHAVFDGRYETPEDVGTAIRKAFAATTIENYSEMLGAYFAPMLGIFGKGTRNVLDKITAGRVGQFLDNVASNDFAKAVSAFEKNAQWSGNLGEFAEEIAGGTLNAIIVGDQTFDSNSETGVFNRDNLIDTFLGVTLLGGSLSMLKTAGYGVEKYQQKRAVKRADVAAVDAFGSVDVWDKIKTEVDAASNEELPLLLGNILSNPDVTDDQKTALMVYVGAKQREKGAVIGEQKRRENPDTPQEQVEIEQSFDNGAALETPQEKNDAQNMYEYQQQQMRQYFGLGEDGDVDAFLGDDPIAGLQRVAANDQEAGQVVLDYLNAKATVDGVFQRMSDDAEAKIAEADAIIASRTNRNNGLIQRVRLKNDKQAYVLSGDIVMTDDGDMVNVSKSSESLVVIDAITGKKEYTYPSNIAEVYQSVDAETERQTLREQVIDEYSQKLADDMNGTLAFAPGDNYTLVDDQGAQHNVQIVADNGDGTVVVVEVMPDGVQQEAVMAKSTIQEMSDTHNQLRLGQYLQEKKAQEIALAEQEAQAEQPEVVAEEQTPIAQSAISRIPTNEAGEQLFEQAPVQDTWAALVELNEGDTAEAVDTAQQMYNNAKKELDKAQKQKPKVGTSVAEIQSNKAEYKARVSAAQAKADYWANIVALGEQSAQPNEQTEEVVAENVVAEEAAPVAEQTEITPEVAPIAEEVVEPVAEQPLVDHQGNPIDANGQLIVDIVESVDELSDDDFNNPTRSIQLPKLPKAVDDAIGADGKPIIIKKNIFERNLIRHSDVTPEEGRLILNAALYNPNIYGQNQKERKPYNWVVVSVGGENGLNKLVLLEVNKDRERVEVVHWHFINQHGLEKLKRQAEREDGQLLILPSETSEEVGALSDPTLNQPSESKDTTTEPITQEIEQENLQPTPENVAEEQMEVSQQYTITPAQYTNKRGKVLDMHLVKFSDDLSKEQQKAAKQLAKENRGWWDKDKGGFMMRSEESAKELADAILNNAEAVSDAQPVSLEQMREVGSATNDVVETQPATPQSNEPKWKYELTVYENGRTILERSQIMPNGSPISDGHFEVKADSPREMLGILSNPHNGLEGALEQIGTKLNERADVFDFRAKARTEGVNGFKIGDNIIYTENGKREKGTIHDFNDYGDHAPVLDLGAAPVLYVQAEWDQVEKDDITHRQFVQIMDFFGKDLANADGRVLRIKEVAGAEEQVHFYITDTNGKREEFAMPYTSFIEILESGQWKKPITATEAKPKSKKNASVKPKQVSVEGLFGALNQKGEAKLSDHIVEEQTNPSGNKLVTDERYEELKRKMRQKLMGQMNMGIDPEILAIGTEMALYHIEKGARKFADYAKGMIADLGDVIRPYLKAFYNGARELPEVEREGFADEMTPYDEVRTFDVANFDKVTPNAMATAETSVKEQEVEQQAEVATEKIKNNRNKARKSAKKSVTLQQEVDNSQDIAEQKQKTTDNELQRDDDAVRTEGLPANDNSDTATRSRAEDSEEVQQKSGRANRSGASGSERAGDSVQQRNERSNGRIQRVSEPNNTRNNHSERGEDHAPTSVDARIEANIKAIELAQTLIENGESATPAQMAILRKFSGWGGLGKVFTESSWGWRKDAPPTRLRELLGEEAYQQAVMSANSSYYTPAYVIDTLWDIAEKLGFEGGNILEGSAGIGNILGQMPKHISEQSNIQAVEIDETAGNILSLLYPDAKVDIQGFEQTQITNGSVDLAITNVPFVTGLRVNDTTSDRDLSKKFHNIHDFCIAKNVRKLRPGGIGIFITSNGTLDNSKKLRDWVVNEGGADFIGAFRLNNKTFSGTAVTSDIVVIRKRVNGKRSANAIDVSTTSGERTAEYDTGKTRKVKGVEAPIIKELAMDYNRYFMEHPENMAGEMQFGFENGDTYRPTSKGLYPTRGKDQGELLNNFVQSFEVEETLGVEVAESREVVDVEPDKKVGEVFVRDGQLFINQTASAQPLGVNANKVKGHTKVECFEAYSAIKDALNNVLEYQQQNEDDKGLKSLLDRLNKAYDDFVETYGYFNKNTAIAFLRNDVDYANVASIETFEEQGDKKGNLVRKYGKADVMKGRVIEKDKEPTPTNIKDGIVASIFKHGRIDVPYIAKQLGQPESEVKTEIIDSGLGFEDPTTLEMTVSYQYLSGNVREKLRQAQENNENGAFDKNIKALEQVIPMNIPAHLIDFTLGSSWIDPKLYDEYVKDRTDIDVKFTAVGGTWFMDAPEWGLNKEKNRSMGVVSQVLQTTIMGHKLIEAAIQNKTITVSTTRKRWDGSTETITDKDATQACAAKIDEIRQDFKEWARNKMQSDSEMSAHMERIYNDTFNNYVPVHIPDEFVPKYFSGAARILDGKPLQMRPHQGRAIVRGTMQPLMLAHEVGTGKTYTLISTAMEMRRLGTARKPMVVVQNATVGQFVASAKELYPNAKILTLDDADRNAEGRKNFYAKIKYNDWDMIVVPQSTFEFIPDSEERQMAFVQDKIEEKMIILEQMKDADRNSKSLITRQAEKEIEDLEAQLAELTKVAKEKRTAQDEKKRAVALQNAEVQALEMLDRRTDDVENFDDMGIDALLIDEAHEYKHLGFATAMQRGVKGVDPSYSKKSQGVFLKTQAVLENNNGRNVIFATGTPISNTAAEIWTFMRYLMPADTMKEYGIYYFDDFVRNFGNIQQMLEFTTSGKFKENNRFAGYVNLPELVRIWSGVADTVLTAEAGGVKDKIPEMEGGQAQDLYLPQTRALRGIMKFVKAQLDAFDQMSGKQKKENSHIPLTMYGIAKAAAVDARLVLPNAEDDANSKTNEAVRQILRSLKETDKYNGTVALFADNYQNKQSGFNLYEDIRSKLIAAGIPAEKIAIIKSGMTVKKKLDIFDKVNRGEIRVIMGSTFTLGTGVNIQERLHTLIHLDAPKRPMDYTQRNGRILRQGNLHKDMNKPVRVLRFGVEDSLDVTAYQRLKTKGAIADSIMHGKQMMSDSMTNRVLEEEEDVFGDTVAQLSGSEYAMLKNNAEKNVRKFESRKKQWEADQIYIHNNKPKLIGKIKQAKQRAEDNKKYLESVRASFPGGKFDAIVIGKNRFENLDAMADFIKDHNKTVLDEMKKMRENPYGSSNQSRQMTVSIGNFDFTITTTIERELGGRGAQLFTEIHRKMAYSCPELGLQDIPVKQGLLRNAIEDITENVITGKDFEENIEYATRSVENNTHELAQLQSREGKPFEYEAELQQAKDQYKEYSELMKKEMAEKEAKYAEIDQTVDAAEGVMDIEEDDDNIRFRTSDRAEVIANFDADFAELESEYQQLDKNDEQAMAEWRAKKKQVVESYLNYMTDEYALPGSVFVFDHNDADSLDEAAKLMIEVVAEQEGINVNEIDPSELKECLDYARNEFATSRIVGRMMRGRGVYNIGRAINENTSKFWLHVLLHENTHYLLEQHANAKDFEDIWAEAENSPTKKSQLIKEHYSDKGVAGMGNEVVAYAVGDYAKSKHSQTLMAFIEGDERISIDDVVKNLDKSLPLRNELVIEVLNKLRDEYQRQETEVNTDRGDQEANREREAARQGQESGERSPRRDSQATGQPRRDLNAIATTAEELAEQLHTPIRIVRDVAEITDDNRTTQIRKRAAKGWYDVSTGEVVVVAPNATSVADVQRTVIHEVVAHNGLRELFGADFDTFLDNVYRNVDEPIRRAIANLAARKGWDFRVATEEYLASLAETTNFEEIEKQGWWQKIKDYFMDLLRKVGIKLAKPLTNDELRYILWRSYQMQKSKGAMAVAEDVDMQRKLGVGNFRTRQGALQKANEQFNRELQEYIENGAKPNTLFHIGMPQGVMRDFLPNLPIVMLPRVLKKASRTKHNVELSALRNLPSMIAEPIFVFNREDGKLGVLTEIKDRDGKNVCVAIELNKTIQDGGTYLEVNDIVTIHGRDVANIILPIAHNNTLRYVDKKKGLDWLSSASYNYQQEIDSKDLDSATKIVEDFDNSKYKASKNMPDNIRAREGSPTTLSEYEGEDIEADFADYDAGAMTFEESITNGLVKLSQANQESAELRMNAIRAIGGNLAKLRRAMNVQRKYDKAAIDSVIRIAKMAMNSGFFNGLSHTEVNRLLTLINKAASSRDITKQARAVVDMLLQHQVREAKRVFEKMLKVRGSKVDNRGIVVQGKLDNDGQRMIATFKEAIKLSDEALQERIDQTLDEMGSDNNTVASNATIEYQGLLLAQQYLNDIRQSEIEEAGIRKELREVTEKELLTGDDYKEFVESVEDAIRENRLERIEAYSKMIAAIGEGMSYSIARAKEWREQQKQRVQEIHHDANSDLQGVPTDEHSKLSWKQRLANNGILRFVTQSLGTFEQYLRYFGGKSANGEGYLYNRFIPTFLEASDKEWKNKKAAQDELSAKLSDIMGKKMSIMDVFSMMRKMPTVSVQFWDISSNSKREDKGKKTYELTQGNLLYIYMVNKMSDGRMKLRNMGISEQDVAEITKVIDPRFIKFADWLQDEFLVKKRNEYNEVHKRMFGASMAAIENYFPLVINSRSRNAVEKVEEQQTDDKRPSTITGSIIKRVRNSTALDLTNADAFAVVLDHVDQMERWAAFAEFNRDINALLSYKRFRNKVLNMSSARFGAGNELWKNFKDTCAIAAGVYRPKGNNTTDAFVLNIAKGATASKITFRLWTAIKQLLSLPAFFAEASVKELAKACNPVGAVDAWNWALEEVPTFAKRWQSRQAGDSRLRKTDVDWKLSQTKIMETAVRMGMTPNAFIDALSCVIGAKAVYETKYKRYLKQGYSEAKAKQKALIDASNAFNTTQQSSEGAYLSTIQEDRTVASVALTVFRNSNMAYARKVANALANLKRRLKKGYREESIAHTQKQMMRDGLSEAQALSAATRLYNRQFYKDCADVLIFGFGMNIIWELGSYLPYLIMGDDDEEKEKVVEDALMRSIAGPIEGLVGGDIVKEAIGWKLSGKSFYGYSFGSIPMMEDIQNILSKFDSDKIAAINDVVNILIAAGMGVNLQTLTDTAVAILDATEADPTTSKEAALLIMRIMQIPQSQIDEIYIDELGISAREARDVNPEALAHRYAEYKRKKATPITGVFYSDEEKEKAEKKYVKRFEKLRKERVEMLGDPVAREIIEDYEDDELNDTKSMLADLKKLRKQDATEYFRRISEFDESPEYQRYQTYKEKQDEIDDAIKAYDWRRVEQLRTALADELSKSYALQTNEDASK